MSGYQAEDRPAEEMRPPEGEGLSVRAAADRDLRPVRELTIDAPTPRDVVMADPWATARAAKAPLTLTHKEAGELVSAFAREYMVANANINSARLDRTAAGVELVVGIESGTKVELPSRYGPQQLPVRTECAEMAVATSLGNDGKVTWQMDYHPDTDTWSGTAEGYGQAPSVTAGTAEAACDAAHDISVKLHGPKATSRYGYTKRACLRADAEERAAGTHPDCE